jgi:hypothetical protein
MSHEPTRTLLPAGEFVSEPAVRAAPGRRSPASCSAPARAGNGVPAYRAAAGEDTLRPTDAPRRLRRWSVAELIARAVAAHPSTT